MLLKTWRMLAPSIPHLGRRIGLLMVLGLVSSLAETVALLGTARIALTLGGASAASVSIPALGAIALPPTVLAVAACIAAVVSLASHVVIAWMSGLMSAQALQRTRASVIAAFTRATWEAQSAEREGSVHDAAGALSARTSALVLSFVNLGTNAVMVVVFLVSSLVASPIATLVVFVVGIVVFAALRPIARATRRAGTAAAHAEGGYAEQITRFVSTTMERKVFGVEAASERAVNTASTAASDAQRRLRLLSQLGTSLFRDVAILLLVTCITVLSAIGGDVDAASVVVVITLVLRGLVSAQAVNTATQSANEHGPGISLLRERIARWQASVEPAGEVEARPFRTIRVADAGYRYPGVEGGVTGLDLEIAAGEAIGVIGRSGAGKTTFVQLLLRLRRPTSGAILLDGRDYTEFTAPSWSAMLGFVPQEPSLLSGTIADNIDFDRGLARDALERAADDAHVSADVRRFEGGFDHVLGPRGSGLSGGQKQRIAIARALAAGPRLLVLDEPTSALDPHSEALLVETLTGLKGRTTMVIVAHRLTTVRMCDRLVVFENGRITKVGTPAEILDGPGYDQAAFFGG